MKIRLYLVILVSVYTFKCVTLNVTLFFVRLKKLLASGDKDNYYKKMHYVMLVVGVHCFAFAISTCNYEHTSRLLTWHI